MLVTLRHVSAETVEELNNTYDESSHFLPKVCHYNYLNGGIHSIKLRK